MSFGRAGMMKLNSSDTLWGDVPNWFANSLEGRFSVSDSTLSRLPDLAGSWRPGPKYSAQSGWFSGLCSPDSGPSASIILTIGRDRPGFTGRTITRVLRSCGKATPVSDKGFGNYRIPLLFLAMLIPLVFKGAGKLSLDHVLAKRFK